MTTSQFLLAQRLSHHFPKHARIALLTACAFAVCSVAHPGVIATDHAVPEDLDHGGTAADPAVYIIGQSGPVHITRDYIYIGDYTSHNHLVIRNGSTLVSNTIVTDIGWSGDHNTITVTGPGSTWDAEYLRIGTHGSHNRVVVENGGLVRTSDYVDFSYDSTGHHNSALITGPGSRWETFLPIYMDGNGHHSLVIENGGVFTTTIGTTRLGAEADIAPNNTIRVSGPGSAWFNGGGLNVVSSGNTITIENGGLVTASGDYGFDIADGLGNHVRLNGGFLAIYGYQIELIESLIADGIFQFWNGTEWVTGGDSSFSYSYFSYGDETDAELLTGHKGLGNYTIITAAYLAPIPEPATFVTFAGLGALATTALRRRRRHSRANCA